MDKMGFIIVIFLFLLFINFIYLFIFLWYYTELFYDRVLKRYTWGIRKFLRFKYKWPKRFKRWFCKRILDKRSKNKQWWLWKGLFYIVKKYKWIKKKCKRSLKQNRRFVVWSVMSWKKLIQN